MSAASNVLVFSWSSIPLFAFLLQECKNSKNNKEQYPFIELEHTHTHTHTVAKGCTSFAPNGIVNELRIHVRLCHSSKSIAVVDPLFGWGDTMEFSTLSWDLSSPIVYLFKKKSREVCSTFMGQLPGTAHTITNKEIPSLGSADIFP